VHKHDGRERNKPMYRLMRLREPENTAACRLPRPHQKMRVKPGESTTMRFQPGTLSCLTDQVQGDEVS
jgi:hypothetical protein